MATLQGPHAPTSQSGSTQLSQIEKSVTHLLVATKQLLETLTQWSRGTTSDAAVSDVYVRLGYEFNIACRAFTAINVDTSDLGNVPEELRHILESTLSQEASVESLDRYLPKIRDIIIGLLHGLKRKQQKLRQKQAREGTIQNGEGSLARESSINSVGSGSTGLTNLLNEGLPAEQREESYGGDRLASNSQVLPPPRTSSTNNTSPSRRGLPTRESARSNISNQSSMSSTTAQNIPVMGPGEDAPPQLSSDIDVDSFPPPPLPAKQQNALAALQRGGDLERRASRRYSAYQISKHLGSSPIGVPMLPPAQNSPIPNRGRDTRESMNAVRGRGSMHHRQKSSQGQRLDTAVSPSRLSSHISEEGSLSGQDIPVIAAPDEVERSGSPIAKTPDDKLRRNPFDDAGAKTERRISGTMTSPPGDVMPVMFPETPKIELTDPARLNRDASVKTKAYAIPENPPRYSAETSPPPGKELTLFLQYKTRVKKFVLAEGYEELSLARLQLAFIEKFAWNTHNNGVDLPEIYLQDPVSGVRHELEDLTDVKDRSVLVLNIEQLDEVKKHIDEGIGGLKTMISSLKDVVNDQKLSIQRVTDRQQDAAKEMAKMAAVPSSARASWIASRTHESVNGVGVSTSEQVKDVDSLRRDLAVVRQTYATFRSDIESSMEIIRKKASAVTATARKAVVPDVTGNSGRAYLDAGKKNLNEDSDKLVSQVDDLQDIVEDLRKDVVTRGVRPLPRQLETVAKDISLANQELKKMQDFLKREKPIWTRIWEKELETVCTDREEMTMQEDLARDLEDDLEKASQTFALVEQATKEQLKDAPPGGTTAIRMPRLNHIVPSSNPTAAKEGVLGEVRALQPNHENRLEAIERAEKLRQKELELRRGGEFQKELGDFVEEGKLKKAGGYEEVERQRKAKDEKIRREVWERQNGMTQADALANEDEEEDEEEEEEEEEQEEVDGEDVEDDTTATQGDDVATPAEEFVDAQEVTNAGQ